MAKIKTFEGKEIEVPGHRLLPWAEEQLKEMDKHIEELRDKISTYLKYKKYLRKELGLKVVKDKKASAESSQPGSAPGENSAVPAGTGEQKF